MFSQRNWVTVNMAGPSALPESDSDCDSVLLLNFSDEEGGLNDNSDSEVEHFTPRSCTSKKQPQQDTSQANQTQRQPNVLSLQEPQELSHKQSEDNENTLEDIQQTTKLVEENDENDEDGGQITSNKLQGTSTQQEREHGVVPKSNLKKQHYSDAQQQQPQQQHQQPTTESVHNIIQNVMSETVMTGAAKHLEEDVHVESSRVLRFYDENESHCDAFSNEQMANIDMECMDTLLNQIEGEIPVMTGDVFGSIIGEPTVMTETCEITSDLEVPSTAGTLDCDTDSSPHHSSEPSPGDRRSRIDVRSDCESEDSGVCMNPVIPCDTNIVTNVPASRVFVVRKHPRVCIARINIAGLQLPRRGGLRNITEKDVDNLEKPNGLVQCPCCEKSFAAWTKLQIHMQRQHGSVSLPYQCQYCKRFFLKESGIITHLSMTHNRAYCKDEQRNARTGGDAGPTALELKVTPARDMSSIRSSSDINDPVVVDPQISDSCSSRTSSPPHQTFSHLEKYKRDTKDRVPTDINPMPQLFPMQISNDVYRIDRGSSSVPAKCNGVDQVNKLVGSLNVSSIEQSLQSSGKVVELKNQSMPRLICETEDFATSTSEPAIKSSAETWQPNQDDETGRLRKRVKQEQTQSTNSKMALEIPIKIPLKLKKTHASPPKPPSTSENTIEKPFSLLSKRIEKSSLKKSDCTKTVKVKTKMSKSSNKPALTLRIPASSQPERTENKVVKKTNGMVKLNTKLNTNPSKNSLPVGHSATSAQHPPSTLPLGTEKGFTNDGCESLKLNAKMTDDLESLVENMEESKPELTPVDVKQTDCGSESSMPALLPNGMVTETDVERLERPNGTVHCVSCGKNLRTWEKLQVHMNRLHPRLPLPYHCRHCGRYFLKEIGIKNHLSMTHNRAYCREEQQCARTVLGEDGQPDQSSGMNGKRVDLESKSSLEEEENTSNAPGQSLPSAKAQLTLVHNGIAEARLKVPHNSETLHPEVVPASVQPPKAAKRNDRPRKRLPNSKKQKSWFRVRLLTPAIKPKNSKTSTNSPLSMTATKLSCVGKSTSGKRRGRPKKVNQGQGHHQGHCWPQMIEGIKVEIIDDAFQDQASVQPQSEQVTMATESLSRHR